MNRVSRRRERRFGAGVFGLLVAVSFCAVGCGEDAPETPDEPGGATQADGVRSAAASLMRAAAFPGLSLALFDRAGVTFSHALGTADEAGEVPVTADTSFWLASVTKPITGLALLRAREDGALSLDTHVSELLAEKDAFTLGYEHASDITLRHLVTHRSSIRDSDNYACSYFVGDEAGEHVSLANELYGAAICDETSPAELGGFLESYLSEGGTYYGPDNFAPDAPGTRVEYSNVGAGLAGYSLELATGVSLADYARSHFFAPLGLEHTSFRLAELPEGSVASPRLRDPDTGATEYLPRYDISTWPDGGLRSSANDFGKLMAALLNGGELDGTRILEEASVRDAFTPLETFEGDVQIGVFWVLQSNTELTEDGSPVRIAGHDGGDPGAFSLVVLELDTGAGMLVLANGDYVESTGAEAALAELVKKSYAYAVALAHP